MVMPSWAPESWVDSDRSAASVPPAPGSPASAACSIADRSTVTKANSAATNAPHAAIRAKLSTTRSTWVTMRHHAGLGTGGAQD